MKFQRILVKRSSISLIFLIWAVFGSSAAAQDRAGAGIIAPQIVRFSSEPVHRLLKAQGNPRERLIPLGDDPVLMLGVIGYHHIGHGIRAGLGGWAGYTSYETRWSGSSGDSTVALRLIPLYGGVLLEKAFSTSFLDIFFGALAGGGTLVLQKQLYLSGYRSDAQRTAGADRAGGAVLGRYLAFDFHSGVSLPLRSGLRLGVDINVLSIYSPAGFAAISGGFGSINPGVRFRFEFGKGGGE